jgi:hypothetical protein
MDFAVERYCVADMVWKGSVACDKTASRRGVSRNIVVVVGVDYQTLSKVAKAGMYRTVLGSQGSTGILHLDNMRRKFDQKLYTMMDWVWILYNEDSVISLQFFYLISKISILCSSD